MHVYMGTQRGGGPGGAGWEEAFGLGVLGASGGFLGRGRAMEEWGKVAWGGLRVMGWWELGSPDCLQDSRCDRRSEGGR